MTDATASEAGIAAGFAKQLEQRPPGTAEEAAPLDDEAQATQDDLDDAPDLEADAASAGDEDTERETESDEDLGTDHLASAIQPPLGLTAEQQSAFAQLDPELQSFVSTREAQRTADYTAKSEQLATERKALEAQTAEVAQQRAQYAQLLQGVTQQELKPPAAALAQDEPEEYQVQMARYNEAKYAQDLAKAELARVEAEHKADIERQQKAHQERVDGELPNLIPELRDPTKADAVKTELKAHATSRGISEEQYGRATAGELLILYESMMFRKGQGAKPGRKAPPKAQRPGSSRRPAPQREAARTNMKQAAKRTSETGDLSHVWGARLRAEGKK